MEQYPQVFPLEGTVQHYAWGGFRFIPELLGCSNRDREPFAELWMGAHPKGPSRARLDSQTRPLDVLIAAAPRFFLGGDVDDRFQGRLPFLFKILDVRSMLSIQAHPNKEQAEAGFARENRLGIPPDAPNRIFRDDNHKPEVMVALTDFWLLHGFSDHHQIGRLPERVPEFAPLAGVLRSGELRQLYQHLMSMPQSAVNRLLAPLEGRLKEADDAGTLAEDQPEYWAAQAFREYTSASGDYDRGIFSIFLMNLVHVPAGKGIYQGAGIPHAYLRGVNVELMANSDNVFRGGLTPKHVDVGALMEHLSFHSVDPVLIDRVAKEDGLSIFPTPAPDFLLSRIEIGDGKSYHPAPDAGPRILIVMEGAVTIDGMITGGRGSIFYLCPGAKVRITSGATSSTLFCAGVPPVSRGWS